MPPERPLPLGPMGAPAAAVRTPATGLPCSRCGGSSVVTSPRGGFAAAEVCECSVRCPVCRGSKFLFHRDDEGREVARICECETRRQRIRLFNEAGIPAKYHDARLDPTSKDKDNKTAFETLSLFSKEYIPGHQGLVLMGGPGIGKTYLLCALLHDLVFRHGIPVQFRDFFHLLNDLRSGYSQDKPESELIQPLVDVEVLAVDELGKGRNTPWEQNILDVIISHRYNSRKTTLFTTNYTDSRNTTLAEPLRGKDSVAIEPEIVRELLQERVGPRIFSRLKEMCHFVTMQGRDRREALAAGLQ